MNARYFVHLFDGRHLLPDDVGVEVGDPDHLLEVVMQTVREMVRDEELDVSELDGWEVRVVDDAGTLVKVFGLADLEYSSC